MGLFEQLPYTNFHELNLTELVKLVKDIAREMHDFEVVNKISYGGEWDITKQYTPWTVVAVNGTEGYISVKPVPAGIDYTNIEYWRLVADFTVQLANLGYRVSVLENNVDALNNTVANHTSSINSIDNYVHNRTTSRFNDRNILFIGDSYTNASNVQTPWYVTMCESINPANYYVSTIGGCAFCLNAGYHYYDMAVNFVNSHTTSECESITDLFITGGYNDNVATISDIQDDPNNPYNMEKTVGYCRQYFPNATIYIAYFSRTPLVRGNARHAISNIERTATAYREGARHLGCKYVDRSEVMLHDYRLFDSDNVHPNQLGHAYLGHYVAQWFMNGSWSYNTDVSNNARTLNISQISNEVVDGHQTVLNPSISSVSTEQLTDEGVIVRINGIQSAVTSGGVAFDCAPATSNATNTFNLGYFNNNNARAYFSLLGTTNTIKIMGNAIIKSDANTFHDVPCIITFTPNNEILLNFQKMNGNAFQHYGALNSITYIAGVEFVIPLHAC